MPWMDYKASMNLIEGIRLAVHLDEAMLQALNRFAEKTRRSSEPPPASPHGKRLVIFSTYMRVIR